MNSNVVKVDAKTKQVVLEDGAQVNYDKLLIATGGSPIKPQIPGVDLQNVFVL